MPSPIGYYVHHQGRGHLARALAIARHAPGRFTLIGSGLAGRTGDVPCLELAPDLPDAATLFDPGTQPQSLHYAPLHHAGLRERMAALAGWIAAARPALLVCDVSVEVAMLARLLATPTVYVRLPGVRDDPAHLEAFRSARALLSPFHEELEDPQIPGWLRAKIFYGPGITEPPAARRPAAETILVVSGAGGAPFSGEEIAAAAAATPGYRWCAIGAVTPVRNPPANFSHRGWVDDAAALIAGAGVVIGAGGDGLVGAVIAAGRPFICLPQKRPYGEQEATAARLQVLGAAVSLRAWPPAAAWPGLIAQASALDLSRLTALHDPRGACKAAAFLLAAAA
jgi:hypothetical protein